jgi:hypothetical protein
MAKTIEIKESDILERWSYLIEGAEGRGEEIYKKTEENINRVQPPQVELKREKVAAERILVSFLGGPERELLLVKNKRLKGYEVYIGAKDYGKQLMVSWYLVSKQGGLEKIREAMGGNILISIFLIFIFIPLAAIQRFVKKSVSHATMGLFDYEELSAYTTTVHHSVLSSVGDLMTSLKQDPSKIDRKSKGFLNIS